MAKTKTAAVAQNTVDRIAAYLSKRNTAATAKEISTGSKSNPHTVRKLLGVMIAQTPEARGHAVVNGTERKCRVSGNAVKTYALRRETVATQPTRVTRSMFKKAAVATPTPVATRTKRQATGTRA
jgi:hypothetical protein